MFSHRVQRGKASGIKKRSKERHQGQTSQLQDPVWVAPGDSHRWHTSFLLHLGRQPILSHPTHSAWSLTGPSQGCLKKALFDAGEAGTLVHQMFGKPGQPGPNEPWGNGSRPSPGLTSPGRGTLTRVPAGVCRTGLQYYNKCMAQKQKIQSTLSNYCHIPIVLHDLGAGSSPILHAPAWKIETELSAVNM